MSFIRHTAWNGAATIVSTLGRVAITALLAHRLGPELFGVFVFTQWLIEICFLLFSFGLSGSATRFFPQFVQGDAAIAGFDHWFTRAVISAAVLTVGAATISAILFAGATTVAMGAAIALWALSHALWALVTARAQGLFEFKLMAVCSSILVVVTIVGLALPQTQDNLIAVVMTTGAAQLTAATMCAWWTRRASAQNAGAVLGDPERRRIREFGGNVWITSLVAFLVWSRGEIPVIRTYTNDTSVGLYSGGITLTGMVGQGMSLLTGALTPTIARLWDSGNRAELAAFTRTVSTVLLLTAGLGVGFVICFAHQIVDLLFGPRFQESAGLVWILSFGVFGLASGCGSLVVQIATNARFARNTNFLAGGALFVLLVSLIPPFGLEGAAVARSVVQLGVGVATFIWLGRVLGPDGNARANIRALGLLVVLSSALAGFRWIRPDASIALLSAAYGAFAALAVLVCAGGSVPAVLRTARALARLRHA